MAFQVQNVIFLLVDEVVETKVVFKLNMISQLEILTPYACLNGMRRVLGFLGTRDAMRWGYLDVPGRVGLLGSMVSLGSMG